MERKKPKEVIPQPYEKLFENYEYFNSVQSTLLNDLLHTDNSVVLSAPTGSGKTVAFELAIVRLLEQTQNMDCIKNIDGILPKAIYIAPIKALCSEKFDDWRKRFESVGVNCIQLTGDTETGNLTTIAQSQIVISTPEKWDSLTRRWRDFNALLPAVKLFIIDEVHLLNEDIRGPILEAIVARMKSRGVVRFIIASATIPNVEDLTSWIRDSNNQVSQFVFSEKQRPVPLEKHVVGYNSSVKGFQFDIKLNYQLPGVLRKYAENKAALVFCSSRKSSEMAAFHLNKSTPVFELNFEQKSFLNQLANRLIDAKLRRLVENGIAYHHAGLQYADRQLIESSFKQGYLMVLLSTSTLAMGINLPAHLVVIKSTESYISGSYMEYPENMILQMIGRAGRPQYDTKGVAVILTQNHHVNKYQMLLNGKAPIESHLHKHLAEHLNAEIALNTITNLEVAMKWVRSTYLYVRTVRNPTQYGLDTNLTKDFVERNLEQLCLKHINALNSVGLVTLSHVNGLDVETTDFGKLMAKFYLCFDTMKLFRQLKGNETLLDILNLIINCKELSEFTLRVNEKRSLNELNKSPIRFPIKGRIKTHVQKISCLIQVVLGNIEITTPGLVQESLRIMRICDRVAKCLLEYVLLCVQKKTNNDQMDWYGTLLNVQILAKCFHTKLWEDSEYASKQLHGIGNVYSNLLVNAGKTTLKSLAKTDARTIEMILSKSAPFGDELLKNLLTFPDYEISLKRSSPDFLQISIKQINECYAYNGRSQAVLIVGDSLNNILLFINNLNETLNEYGYFERKIKIEKFKEVENVYAHVVHTNLVGVDVHETLEINPPKKDEKKPTPKRKRQRQKKLDVAVNITTNSDHSEQINDEEKQEENSISNAEIEVTPPKLKKFSYKIKKIQYLQNCNESETSIESVINDTKITNDTTMNVGNTTIGKNTQRKITEFFGKHKNNQSIGNKQESSIDLTIDDIFQNDENANKKQSSTKIVNFNVLNLNENHKTYKHHHVDEFVPQKEKLTKTPLKRRPTIAEKNYNETGLSTPKKLKGSDNTIKFANTPFSSKSTFNPNDFFSLENSFPKSSKPSTKNQKISPKSNTSLVPLTLASFLADRDTTISIESLLEQAQNETVKTSKPKKELKTRKNLSNNNLLNDSLLFSENIETNTTGPLDLSKSLSNTTKLTQRRTPTISTTQNLTTFNTQLKLPSNPPTKDEFLLWYKVAIQFRKLPRHALTLSNFQRTYYSTKESTLKYGNFKATSSVTTKSSSTSSKTTSEYCFKNDSGIEPSSSTFRLKLFDENEINHKTHNAFEVKLINKNIMNLVLNSKCNYSPISDSLDKMEKDMDIASTQSSTGRQNFF